MNYNADPEPRKAFGLTRRQFLNLMGKGLLGTAVLGVGGWAYISKVETGWIDTVFVDLQIKRLPPAFRGFRLAHITDIHISEAMTGAQVSQVAQTIMQLKPDLVAVTGDFVDKSYGLRDDIPELTTALRPLASEVQVAAVLGNHDYSTGPDAVREIFYKSGIRELYNQVLTLDKSGQHLHIVGLDDLISGDCQLSQVVDRLPQDGAAVLLMHEPDFADQAFATGRFDLQLSGHTHGGQIVIPYVGPLVLPKFGINYPSGLYRLGEMFLYTNRGLGTIPPRVRFNCRPEITLFRLWTE